MSGTRKVAVVTGAGSGVGRACMLALLREGYTVALAGRRVNALEETAGFAGADAALFGAVRDRHDVMFNNAGGNVPSTSFEDLTFEQWTGVVAVNLTGVFLCAQAAFCAMKAQAPQGRRIINNGSVSAHAPRPGSAPYTSTKHAITGLTNSISLDGRRYGIACGQIDIGHAATPMTARMTTGVPQANGIREVEPMMDVNCVARSVVLMAGMPLDANVQFLTVMATHMPFVGRG